VFRGEEETKNERKINYWLGVRSSAPKVSSGLKKWLSDQSDKCKVGEMPTTRISAQECCRSQHTAFAINSGKRNRRRLLADAADILGVEIPTRMDSAAVAVEVSGGGGGGASAAAKQKPRLAVPDISNPTHIMRHITQSQRVVYYDNCTPTDKNIQGVVISRASSLGPVIHRGKRTTGNMWSGWKNPETYSAYPIDTGRKESVRDLAKSPAIIKDARRTDKFAWKGNTTWNPFLARNYYHPLGDEFRAKSLALGKDSSTAKDVKLSPILGVIAPSTHSWVRKTSTSA